jgi:biopolymer transport protein ExbD
MGGGGGSEEGDFGFQIAPMVDVVFVLLLFFMALAGANQKEGFLTISLPSQAAAGSDSPIIPIVVDINNTGQVFINGVQRGGGAADKELQQLTDDLTREMEKGRAAGKTDPVIIRPQPDTPHEHVINVLNSCRKARVENLSFS